MKNIHGYFSLEIGDILTRQDKEYKIHRLTKALAIAYETDFAGNKHKIRISKFTVLVSDEGIPIFSGMGEKPLSLYDYYKIKA